MHIITKFANGCQTNLKQLNHLIKYVTNPQKTNKDLIYGNKLFTNDAFNNMMLVKQLSSQESGRQYIHWITSFDPNDNVNPQLAHRLGKLFAAGFNEYQWLMATHTDRNHIHNHYIMNSINTVTGKKFSQSKTDLEKLKNYIDETYDQTLMFEFTLPNIQMEDDDMYYDKKDFYIEDLDDETYDNSNEISDLRKDIKELTHNVNMVAQCMGGFMQMCNPQTLSNAISYEIDRQLNQRFGPLQAPNQKYLE